MRPSGEAKLPNRQISFARNCVCWSPNTEGEIDTALDEPPDTASSSASVH
jgi:hypothetical protein